jgi:hypothetical protein
MKHFFIVPSVLAILSGSLVLLTLLAWASLQDPNLIGAAYAAAVVRALFGTRAVVATVAGTAAVILGLAALLYAAFLAGASRPEWKDALPAYWAALGISSAALFLLLVAVNSLGQQSHLFPVIERWFGE